MRSNATSQSNLASLGEVIRKAPGRPAGLQHARLGAGPAGAEAALADFNKAISLDPDYRPGLRQPRPASYRQTRTASNFALADYNKALSHRCSATRRPISAAASSTASRAGAQALADFNKAVALKPDNAQAYYNRGLLYQGQRQHQFAIDDFSTASRPHNAEGRALRGASAELSRRRRRQIGGERPRRRGADRPANLQAWTSRGLAYERLGAKETAAGSYAEGAQHQRRIRAGPNRLRPRRRQGPGRRIRRSRGTST